MLDKCYLGANIFLQDLDLLCQTLLSEEVTDKVLGGGLTLVTGDGGLGKTHSNKEDQEQLHSRRYVVARLGILQ